MNNSAKSAHAVATFHKLGDAAQWTLHWYSICIGGAACRNGPRLFFSCLALLCHVVRIRDMIDSLAQSRWVILFHFIFDVFFPMVGSLRVDQKFILLHYKEKTKEGFSERVLSCSACSPPESYTSFFMENLPRVACDLLSLNHKPETS